MLTGDICAVCVSHRTDSAATGKPGRPDGPTETTAATDRREGQP
ncbi:hypothetical protein M2432_002678 [Mycobacterium sp. OTB74]|nr:hypothetical protein [Mycobacterium sp. OTB74]